MREYTHEYAVAAGLIDPAAELEPNDTPMVPPANLVFLGNASTHVIVIPLHTSAAVTAPVTSRPAEITVVQFDATEAAAFDAAYRSAPVQEWVQAGLLTVRRYKPEPPPVDPDPDPDPDPEADPVPDPTPTPTPECTEPTHETTHSSRRPAPWRNRR